ncbi:tetratricopeptide repeat protein [Striga asiatica]|uniref:Tetratricopeptide repeat protein n=1 Tax=Striga asiatica TaxID=4170 RepID=A0A5A7Q796_STRAF|nr:tetratricopeptide repeat protein [Striga asiatica]
MSLVDHQGDEDVIVEDESLRQDQEVNAGQPGHQEVKPVQVPVVEVLGYPPEPPTPCRHHRHQTHQQAVGKIPEAYGCHAEGAPEALHPIRRLPVEEVELPHVHEHLRGPHQHVLRHLPQYAHRSPCPQPHNLQGSGCRHCQSRNNEASGHALELCGVEARNEAAVDSGCHAGGRDAHAGAREVGVHQVTLLHEERRHLGEHHRVRDGAEPDGEHAQYALGFLHLSHCAQPPRVGGRETVAASYRGCLPSTSYSSSASALTALHFLTAATNTCMTLVTGFPLGFMYAARARTAEAVAAQKPRAHRPASSWYTRTVLEKREPRLRAK